MSLSHSSPTRSNRASTVVIALIASLLVLVFPNQVSKADYISFDTSAITYNDRVCNLGDPADHLTDATAFEISTSEQLWEITDCVSNSATIYFELGDDIDVSDAVKAGSAPTSSPIGFSTSDLAYSFSGALDGNNKIISGISMSTTSYGVGLFAYLHNATISNLMISGSFVTTTATSNIPSHSAGGLAIRADGSLHLSAIHNQVNVSGSRFVGGLLGYVGADASITSSNNAGTISGVDQVGGLVGYVDNNANIDSSYNTGTVSGIAYLGGLVGLVLAEANINFSNNTGTVSGSYQIGGLVGFVVADANIASSYNTGPVSGTGDRIGGLVGDVNVDANITSSYNIGPVSGSAYVGGLVGLVTADANITSSYNIGPVSGSAYVGGLVGLVNVDANITSSYNAGTVFGSNLVGGLVGFVVADANIASSYNTGPVSGTGDRVGGLVGDVNVDANINSSFNVGTVSGSNYVGGLVGKVSSNANIASSYNAGPVSGTTDVDGLAGKVSGTVTTTSAFTSVTSDHAATSTIADMRLASTYVGFDFTSVTPDWGFGSCTDNQGFPMLQVFAEISNYNSVACGYKPPPQSTPSPGLSPAPVYSGPIISGAQSVVAGAEVTLTGSRLESVTVAHVGGVQVRIVSALAQSLILDIPSSMVPGSYDLVLQSSFGTLTIQSGLTVLAPSDKVEESATKKLTVGSFKGYVAIYTKGYEGQRLSAKVAGKWMVVDSLDESFNGNNYSRTLRYTGAGYDIFVHLYVDGEFIKTEMLTTK